MPLNTDGHIIETMAQGLSPETMPSEGDAQATPQEMARARNERSGSDGAIVVMADTVALSLVTGGAQQIKGAEGSSFWPSRPRARPWTRG
jgi:Ca-activated chloride channel family protein